MSKLPLLTAKQLVKVLKKMDFKLKRQKGSHMFFEHVDGRTTLVPNHPGEDLDRGLLLKIVRQDVQITRGEFLMFL